MYTNIYWVAQFENGAGLAIMPRPRGGDLREEEIKRFSQTGIRTVVSLLEQVNWLKSIEKTIN